MLRSTGMCMFAERVSTVSVGVTWEQLIAHVGGVMRCASPWCCPICTPALREERAVEIDQALTGWLDRGGYGVFGTLTLRHHRADALAPRFAAVSSALGGLLKGSGWERRRDRLGYVGSIRAPEVTWSEVNGWHAHVHFAFLFDRSLTDAELLDLEDWMFSRWSTIATRKGFGSVTREHGIDLRPLTRQGIGEYLTKLDNGWSIGHELTRGDRKGMTPFAILSEFGETGEARLAALWREYEAATKGRRSLMWSKGLRDRLGLGVELSDEDLVTLEAASLIAWEYREPAEVWNERERRGQSAELLNEIEWTCAALKMLGRCAGHGEPPAIGDPRRATKEVG